jgi:transaldolase
MNGARRLHEIGQSLWLDNLTRELLESGTLAGYVRNFCVTGLTSNPTIFDKAIAETVLYDHSILRAGRGGASDEQVFFELAIEDLRRAAKLFRPAYEATGGVDGWVSLEVSPLLARDTEGTIRQANALHARAGIPNLFIKIPGTPEGIPAIEECLVAGTPINVTLLFSAEQYRKAAEAHARAVKRRLASGLSKPVRSVASLFVSRWDKAANERVPQPMHNRLGIAIAKQTYRAYCEFLRSPTWRQLAGSGAPPQRLLWASTGAKDPKASDVLYIAALAAPETINTMPDATLLAYADHGRTEGLLAPDGGNADKLVAEFAKAGVDATELAERLQREGEQAFNESWKDLLGRIAAKRGRTAGPRAA